jgi:hypothetical protein
MMGDRGINGRLILSEVISAVELVGGSVEDVRKIFDIDSEFGKINGKTGNP